MCLYREKMSCGCVDPFRATGNQCCCSALQRYTHTHGATTTTATSNALLIVHEETIYCRYNHAQRLCGTSFYFFSQTVTKRNKTTGRKNVFFFKLNRRRDARGRPPSLHKSNRENERTQSRQEGKYIYIERELDSGISVTTTTGRVKFC